MRALPAAITTELAKEVAWIRHLYKLTATATYRWTDCDQDIYFASNYWLAHEINWQSAEFSIESTVPTLSLVATDIDGALKNIALAEDLKRKSFIIYRVLLNSSLGVIGCTVEADLPIVFDGKIDNLFFDRKEATIEIISHLCDWEVICPRRVHNPNCSWAFKGAECGYSGGETWCDFTKSRCVTLGRQANFGGFEYIASLIDQNPYWGSRVKAWAGR